MPASNRERIVEGAIVCIQRTGIAATTTRDIAAASGTSLGSIPYHFGTKDALLNEALLRAMVRYVDGLSARVLDSIGDGADVVATTLTSVLTSFADNRQLIVSLFEAYGRSMHAPTLREQVARHRTDLIARLAELISALPGPGAAPAGVDSLAVTLLSLIDGLMLHWLLNGDSMPRADHVITALRLANDLTTAQSPAAPP